MISVKRTIGGIGNNLFQLAFAIAQGKRHGVEVGFSGWKFAKYFQGDFSQAALPHMHPVAEQAFHHTPEFYGKLDYSQHIDFHGYFQSFKYWEGCEDLIRRTFAFTPEFATAVRNKDTRPFSKPVIALHLRRGDYVGNSNYVNLTPTYYLSALEKQFPDWRNDNLLIFSDNQDYARLHFGCFANAFFAGGSEVEDLCLMSQCQRFITANSSYSWWGAWLSGSKEVVRPSTHFAGGLLARCDIKDFYPESWTVHQSERIDLTECTFLIPVSHDHPDRQKNLELILSMLIRDFDTNVIVMEQGGSKFEWTGEFFDYQKFPGPWFHRTAMLNEMARMARTPIIVNFDADVLFPPAQIMEAVRLIRDGADVSYPYSGRFARMNRKQWYGKINEAKDIGTVGGANIPILRRGDAQSAGGAVFFNREAFWRGGGENENLVSFSPDDAERLERFTKLGFNVARVPGNCWHMEHHCGLNSGTAHPYTAHNRAEWQKVAGMSADELREYVATWEWAFANVPETA